MHILGIHTGHDAGACLFEDQNLVAFCKEERLTRIKNDGSFFDLQAVSNVLKTAGIQADQVDAACFTRMKLPAALFKTSSAPIKDLKRKLLKQYREKNLASEMRKQNIASEEDLILTSELRKRLGLKESAKIHFSNHHRSHCLSALHYSPWDEPMLLVSCDGGGDGAYYSAYYYSQNELETLWGGDETLIEAPQNPAISIGLAYAYATEKCGFKPNRHEGKLTGLAAFGKPVATQAILAHFTVTEAGAIESNLQGLDDLQHRLDEIFNGLSNEDISASIQVATEELVVRWIKQLLAIRPSNNIAMSGGVFSNVRLNQKVAEIPGINEVFIFPAMGDEGLPVGNCIDFLVQKQGAKSLERKRLEDVYLGQPFTGADLVDAAQSDGFVVQMEENPAQKAAKLLAEGLVGAVFHGSMEMGPRALGARSILASPAQREVNDSINKRLQRTEFMPFAPYVLDIDADQVFAINDTNRYACEFMTITTDVSEEWKEKIPAVVHVDGTARPQIIKRDTNWLYYDTLTEFKAITGLACLVNTSFNAHEEPIINTPKEALTALRDNRIDFLICESGLIFKP